MYTSFQLAQKYLHYYRTAHNGRGHGMHSPFLYHFIKDVLHNGQHYTPPAQLEVLRKKLLRDKRLLHIEDLGAGSRVHAQKERKVAQLAKSAVKPPRFSRLFFRLVQKYKPQVVVELGTSLGITTAYLATANPHATVYTIEGSPAVGAVAQENFCSLNLTNIAARIGNFDQVLPSLLQEVERVDLAYIDGNHRMAPTLAYFEALLAKAHNDTILVFDDIHWSAGMEAAWAAIQKHPQVRCTVDVFFLGFVFLRSEFRHSQHFTVRF